MPLQVKEGRTRRVASLWCTCIWGGIDWFVLFMLRVALSSHVLPVLCAMNDATFLVFWIWILFLLLLLLLVVVVVVTIVLCSTCVSVVWCAQNQYFKLRRGRVLGRGRMRQCTLLEAKRIHTTSCTTDMDEVAGDTTADLLSVGCRWCIPLATTVLRQAILAVKYEVLIHREASFEKRKPHTHAPLFSLCPSLLGSALQACINLVKRMIECAQDIFPDLWQGYPAASSQG